MKSRTAVVLAVVVAVTVLALPLHAPAASPAKYRRAEWLPRWPDADGDCQNLRAEILITRSLVPVATNRNGCRVLSGLWLGTYTGRTFTRADRVDIEHIVALSEAHRLGGSEWSRVRKLQLATDRINLLVVDRSENRRKGDRGPDRYMPPAHQCHYLQFWRARVLAKYRLRSPADDAKITELKCIP
jgi:hypothetical protein